MVGHGPFIQMCVCIYISGKIRRKPGPKKSSSIPETLVLRFEVGFGHLLFTKFQR